MAAALLTATRVALLGFGEAGRAFAAELTDSGAAAPEGVGPPRARCGSPRAGDGVGVAQRHIAEKS